MLNKTDINHTVNSRRFQPGDGPSRVLFCDCEIFANLRLKLYLLLSGATMVAIDGDMLIPQTPAHHSFLSSRNYFKLLKAKQSDKNVPEPDPDLYHHHLTCIS